MAEPRSALAALATPAPVAERRLVSVLFVDLVGFTTLAEGRDPEETRDLLTRYFGLAREVIGRYGGTVEKFIGDAVMAVWGAPVAREDDAELAVRAALELVDVVKTLGPSIQARAGVLTGEAAVTIGATGEGMVAGDLVNTASRLQSVAAPGSVLVGETTERAASRAIAFEPLGEQALKGKAASVPVWRALRVVAEIGGTNRAGGLEAPFVGRDDELRLLKDLFHATARDKRPRLVSVMGPAGIGKSRLAWEFLKYIGGLVEDTWWHSGRSPAYGQGITFWALGEMIRRRAGLLEGDDEATTRQKVGDTVARWVPVEDERRWVATALLALLGLGEPPSGGRDELFAAWRIFFEKIAASGPTVLLFEDIQWADAGVLDFIDHLLEWTKALPIFVITLARPDLLERRPDWGAGRRNFVSLALDPLPEAAMRELLAGLVPGLSVSVAKAIVARADGIPLYAVETVRMLVAEGRLKEVDGAYEPVGDLTTLAIPETLTALIAARLDGLAPAERSVLQDAAVLGQSFTLVALAAVTSAAAEGLEPTLRALVRHELLDVNVDPRSPERGQYAFVQSLIREVAYNQLARPERKARHLAAARWFESLGDDELAGALAQHYADAYRNAPKGPEADALAGQARLALKGAADRAAALHSYEQALGYLDQALAVTNDPAEQAGLHERAAEAALLLNRFEAAIEHASAVETLNAAIGDPLGVLRGVTWQATVHMSQHAERPAIAMLRNALASAADLGPSREVAQAQAELARALMLAGAYDESVEWCNRVLSAPAAITERQLVEVVITKGAALSATPGQREAEILLRGAIVVAERMGEMSTALRARNNLLGIVNADSLDDARTLVREGFEIARRLGLRTWAHQFGNLALATAFEAGFWDEWVAEMSEQVAEASEFYRGWAEAEFAARQAFRGDVAGGEAAYRAGMASSGSDSSQASAGQAAGLAGIRVAAGDWGGAIEFARVGWSHTDSLMSAVSWGIVAGTASGEREWIAEALAKLDPAMWLGRYPEATRGFARTSIAMLDGRWDEARGHYPETRRLFAEVGARMWLAHLDLAVGQIGQGHLTEATEAGRAAEEFFRSVGADAFLARYRAAAISTPRASAAAARRGSPSAATVAESRTP